jgi:primosomal protein N' (replication factor Y)
VSRTGGRHRVVDVLPQLKTARFDRELTYAVPAELDVEVGDVVRVPLGPRDVLAYVVSPMRDVGELSAGTRPIARKPDGPRAFDATGLALARFIATTYLCSLGEALGAVVLAGALPRAVERLVPRERPRAGAAHPRLVALLWDDFADGVRLETLLRHPEARRTGDRRALLAAIGDLVRAGALVRERRFERARTVASSVRVLQPGAVPIAGKKAEALVAYVRERGEAPRADAVLAGFSVAVIRRCLAAGALSEVLRARETTARSARISLPALTPTAEQTVAIDAIAQLLDARRFGQVLVHGITGSGKTFVYLAAIARIVEDGGRAIVLVPEIALTPQTARRFEDVFGERVAVLHSGLSERERFEAWSAAARGEIAVVVGARSAVFAPLADVRLIVIDEAHETSYKQDTVPRYSAVEVARERMRLAGGVVVLGSATPALEDYARARAGRFGLVHLRARATAQALPVTHIVDMGKEFEAGNRRMFSTPLLTAMAARLERGEKTVLFVNRRGSARFLLCRECGFVPSCLRCSTSLVVHRADGVLRCHYCDAQAPIPERCTNCGSATIKEFGAGTQRVASELATLFPHARIVRMDSDTTTRVGEHARLLDRFAAEGDVLVGTQMVAKGLDFPQVTLVGAVAADLDLHVADFRAAERTFGLLTQVCGRSGRAQAGEAFIQTYSPGHPAIRFAAAHDYPGFAEEELADRKALRWPPYVRLAYLGIIGREHDRVRSAAETYAARLADDADLEVLGPAPYPIAKLNNDWRYRIAVKCRDAAHLRDIIRDGILPLARAESATRLAVNIDP